MRFLLIFSFLFASSLATEFVFTANLHCSYRRPWCARLTYYEKDSMTAHDFLGWTGFVCTSQSFQSITKSGQAPDDGPIDDGNFELFGYIQHNCREDGEYVILQRIRFPDVSTSQKKAIISYSRLLK